MILGGKTFDELGLVLLKTTQIPILPDVRSRMVQIPGRAGAYDFGSDLGTRQFNLECALKATTRQELAEKVRALAAHLVDTDGKPRTLELIFDDEPDRYYNVKYSGEVSMEKITSVGRFTLQLTAIDPFAYGGEIQVNFVNNSATINNSGTLEALPVIEITFTTAGSEIIVSRGSSYVRVIHAFVAGDTLEINCITKAVLVNGARVLADVDWQHSTFFALPSGESMVTVNTTATYTGLVRFRPRWL